METELKIRLDAEAEARLRRDLAQAPSRDGPLQTKALLSIYFDTEAGSLAEAGIALRLRKAGRRWLQTAKRRPENGSRGFFSAVEVERPAPGGRLRFDIDEPTGLMREIAERVDGAAIGPVFETRVKRTTARLRNGRGTVEVAIDRGEVVAGALSAPIREAEIELVEGEVGAIFDAARALFPEGPIRFSPEPKSDRGLRLHRTGRSDPPIAPRKAGAIDFPEDATVEQAAREVLRDCFAQIADNMVVIVETDDPEGPHQLRVGLRRLRTAFSAFRIGLGGEAFAPLAEEARRLGQVVGRLRDLDVLIDEMVPGVGLDPEAGAALLAVLEGRRRRVRAEVRAALGAPEVARFVLDLGETIEGRGWLVPSDYGQTERLATPWAELLPSVLDKRLRKVVKRGRKLDSLDPEGLHELRKELKKLRYAAELAGPLFSGKARAAFLKGAKALQDTFGTINDAATAAELLAPPREKGAGDARAQWAAGCVVGALGAASARARERLGADWRDFEKRQPFWR